MNNPAILEADELHIPIISMGVEHIAASLGISKTAVFWLIKQKHLPSFKIGRRRLVRVVDLEALAEKLLSGEVEIRLTEEREVA